MVVRHRGRKPTYVFIHKSFYIIRNLIGISAIITQIVLPGIGDFASTKINIPTHYATRKDVYNLVKVTFLYVINRTAINSDLL